MNVMGIFGPISSDSKRDNSSRNRSNRNSMERVGQSEPREIGINVETHWYDWVNPKWRERQLKYELEKVYSKIDFEEK